jgi:hypothetical protein
MVIVHKFYILESDGSGAATVYSGPSAATRVNKKFRTIDAAKAFLLSL